MSDTADGPVATYMCDLGYSITGRASRQCQNDGTGWEGADPTCSAYFRFTVDMQVI